MAHITYGFDATFPNKPDDPWTRLDTIREYLEDCEPIPPDLAWWLGEAIRYSNRDANEFLRRLGLKKKPGRSHHKHAEDAWLKWGERILRVEAEGLKREEALSKVEHEYATTVNESITRSVLQKWRDKYEKALIESRIF